jgi:hypothetical protein
MLGDEIVEPIMLLKAASLSSTVAAASAAHCSLVEFASQMLQSSQVRFVYR